MNENTKTRFEAKLTTPILLMQTYPILVFLHNSHKIPSLPKYREVTQIQKRLPGILEKVLGKRGLL